jgi:hypothetical protein
LEARLENELRPRPAARPAFDDDQRSPILARN